MTRMWAMRALAALLATLFLGSAPTPASAQYEPPKQMTLSPTGVDLTKARFTYKAVDLSIGPLTLERSYLGGPAVEGSSQFGLNWTHNYTTFVIEKNQAKFDGVYVVIGRGVVHFTFTHSGYSCNNPDCDGATLILNGGGAYVYTDAQGNVYTFNPSVKVLASGDSRRSQRIAQVEYADGHSLTYTYSGSQLKQIASNEGYSLVFEYGSSGYISKACGYNRAVNAVTTASTCAGATLAVSYGYAAATWVNLTSVVDVTGQTWGYDYQGTSNVSKMTCLRQVNSSSCLITGNPAPTGGAAYQQTTPDGAVWTYYVSGKDPDENQLPGQPPPISGGGYTGPEGIEVAAQFGAGLLDYYTENGRTTFLQWDGYDLAGLTHPEGNSVGYAYRAGQMISTSWSAKPGSGLATISSGMTLPDLQAPECVSAPPRKICNKPIWREDYNGNRTNYTYDPAHGGVLTETGPAVNPGSGSGAGLVTPQKRFFYVERVAVTAGWEWAGRTIWLLDRTAFCRAGNPNSSNTGCALGASDEVVTSFDYGPTSGPNNLQLRGQAVSADGATLRTCYAYDSLGRKISETSPRGTGGLSACPADPPTQGLPYTASTRYDAAGRVTGTIAPDPDGAGPLPFPALRNSYDTAGRLLKVEKGGLSAWLPETVAPKDWTGFTVLSQSDIQYDAMGRKIGQSTSGGGLVATMTEYGYDLAGRLKCTAVRMNRDAWAYALPDKCVPGPVHPVDGPDRITRNHYDALGQLVRIEKGVGTGLSQVYAAYTYSPNGKPTSVTDANGNRAEMSYDGLDRQKRWIFPSTTAIGEANPADYEEYGYDANASRTSLRKRDGVTISYAYDALGRLTQKTVPTSATGAPGYVVFSGYDNRGLQTYARFGSATGTGITNAWDGFGRLVSTWTSMDGTNRRLSSEYDSDGNRITLWDNGVSYSGKYLYDGLGRMTHYLEGFGPVAFQFSYDSAGRRSNVALGINVASSSIGYGYDSAGRLGTLTRDLAGATWDQSLGFTYNNALQIASRSNSNDLYAAAPAPAVRPYAANGLNQYTAAGGATFAYDANGNLKTSANPAAGTTNYVYDAENRLVSASGSQNATLAYDPLGRLWQVAGPSGAIRFLYDGNQLIQEYNGAGVLLRDYDHGPGADEPLIQHEYAGGFVRKFLHADQQGSIVAVTDTNGAALAINRYDPWGIPAGTNQGRFGYTGQTWIPELGLWYYKARFYSPTLGRFLQTDPVGYADQINLYAYVGNDPINASDPSGLKKDAQCIGQTEEHGCVAVLVEGPDKAHEKPPTKAGPIPPVYGEIDGRDMRHRPQRMQPACPRGPQVNLGAGVSATGFLGLLGLSGGGGVTVSVPTASLPIVGDGSFRGSQVTGSLSITPLAGLGVFLGAGPNYSLGGSSTSTPRGFSGSVTPTMQLGAGDGAGVEVSSDLTSPLSVGGSGGRIAGGAYAAVGARFQGNLSTGAIGCKNQ